MNTVKQKNIKNEKKKKKREEQTVLKSHAKSIKYKHLGNLLTLTF